MTEPNATPTEPWLRASISPEPAGDEGEALLAAIAAYLALRRAGAGEPPREPNLPSRWQTAGRREATRGRAGSPPMGWGRERPGRP